ncbi:unnamed protein product [Mytilus coruscus]|uniref:Uncharacterized protein n=1 Tax=Mytilus coruscus TaxID=42192 RepID=A0A6J8CJB6_MYTCO|nr:unnamed protein product [Mytilus coruscus]
MFINGDSSGIEEVFRKDDSKSVSDQSTLPNCNVIELRATLQSALECISELERSETENQETIKHIKSENNKLKTDLENVNSIPNRSNQQTKINIPVCSPVTDLHSEVNKSANGNISPLSTPKSSTTTNSGPQKVNGLREIDKQLNMTYKIPVRLDGVTEDINTSPADSDENFFTGVKKKRTGRYYLSGINPKSTRSGILAYLEKVNVHVTYLRLFNPKHSAQRVSANLMLLKIAQTLLNLIIFGRMECNVENG